MFEKVYLESMGILRYCNNATDILQYMCTRVGTTRISTLANIHIVLSNERQERAWRVMCLLHKCEHCVQVLNAHIARTRGHAPNVHRSRKKLGGAACTCHPSRERLVLALPSQPI